IYGGAATPICSKVPLKAGQGDTASATCRLGAAQLAAGGYDDRYPVYNPAKSSSSSPNYTYTTSTSTPAKRFTVVAAPTKTTVSFTSPVDYGSENQVNFTVTVTVPDDAHLNQVPFAVDGGFTITRNGKVLCSASLNSNGTGTCTLANTALKA